MNRVDNWGHVTRVDTIGMIGTIDPEPETEWSEPVITIGPPPHAGQLFRPSVLHLTQLPAWRIHVSRRSV
jgi:hypothetical protein